MCLLTNFLHSSDCFPGSRLPSSPQGILQSEPALVFQLSQHVTHSLGGLFVYAGMHPRFSHWKGRLCSHVHRRDCWTAPDLQVYTEPPSQHFLHTAFVLCLFGVFWLPVLLSPLVLALLLVPNFSTAALCFIQLQSWYPHFSPLRRRKMKSPQVLVFILFPQPFPKWNECIKLF